MVGNSLQLLKRLDGAMHVLQHRSLGGPFTRQIAHCFADAEKLLPIPLASLMALQYARISLLAF